jgi:3-deoxy-D-manno-octulosonate 8-phosphate phosphatase (KDO 8-P phosphatase)
MVTLDPEEAVRRAGRLRFVLTDCDGVLTDGGVFYGAEGEALRRFSVRDGMGVERLLTEGIVSGIVSGEPAASILSRARKVGLVHTLLGVRDKRRVVEALLLEQRIARDEVAFIGDDVNDLELLRWIAAEGLTAAPADAMPEVRVVVHHVVRERGGPGAFRAFAEWLLELRNPSSQR